MKRIVAVVAMVALALGATGCGRRRRVETAPAATATAGGQATVYVVGAPAAGAAPAPDYVSQHMSVRYQQFAPNLIPDTPLYHGYLQQGQEESFQTVLEAGRCYRVIGVGGPTMSDLDLFIVDENGNPISQDTATDNFPVLGLGDDMICPRWTGPFYLRALAYSGYGEYGLQLFRTP